MIARGNDSLVLNAAGLLPFSIPTNCSELFKLFAAKVACGSPSEIVGFVDLNCSVGEKDTPEGREKASSMLRTAINRLNVALSAWAAPGNQKPWIGGKRRQGYCLNESVAWSIGESDLAKELTRFSQSVWHVPVSPSTLGENTPLKDQRLPAKPRHDRPRDVEEDG